MVGMCAVALGGIIFMLIVLGCFWRRYYFQQLDQGRRVQPCAFFVDKGCCPCRWCKQMADPRQYRYGNTAAVMPPDPMIQQAATTAPIQEDLGYGYTDEALQVPQNGARSGTGGHGRTTRPVGLFTRGRRFQ